MITEFTNYREARAAYDRSRSALLRSTASGYVLFTPAIAAVGHWSSHHV